MSNTSPLGLLRQYWPAMLASLAAMAAQWSWNGAGAAAIVALLTAAWLASVVWHGVRTRTLKSEQSDNSAEQGADGVALIRTGELFADAVSRVNQLMEEQFVESRNELQQMKTGALFGHCCEAGAILGGADDVQRQALLDYAAEMGLAFQIADDLLDVEGDAAVVGKAVGKDAGAGKATFVTLLGAEGARKKARDLVSQAKSRLAPFAERANLLRELANFVINRQA